VSVVQEGANVKEARGLGRWLSRIAPRSARGAVTIAILPDSKVKALNRRFRGLNRATDVLSFPSSTEGRSEERRGKAAGKARRTTENPKNAKFLGDIVIARGIAQKQAKNLAHPTQIELRVLALHGLLHLLGYDHEVDDGKMARAEARLRRKAGLPLGLIARAS
jgi:probable rRNA maturation factor